MERDGIGTLVAQQTISIHHHHHHPEPAAAMQALHLLRPGLHASCFLLKSVNGFSVWQALQSTIEPLSFSTHDMQRSMPALRRSWLTPNAEVVLSWQQATQRTKPSPAAGAIRDGGNDAVPSLIRHCWHTSLAARASWLRENSVIGLSWRQTVHEIAPPEAAAAADPPAFCAK